MRIRVVVILLVASCGGKSVDPTQTSCQVVGERLAVLDAGHMAKFMTEKDRKRRADRWLSMCEPLKEAQRKCVVQSATIEDARRCTGAVAGSSDDARHTSKTSIKWIVKAMNDGGIVTKLRFAPDGDVIAAGPFRRAFELGGKSLAAEKSIWIARVSPTGAVRWLHELTGKGDDRHVTDVVVDGSGGASIDVASRSQAKLVRFSISADGAKIESSAVLEGMIASSNILADGTVVVGAMVRGNPCKESTFPIHRLDASGKLTWSACNDKGAKPALASGFRHLAHGADGSIAFCGSFLGDAPAWGGTKAPATPTGTHAVVTAMGPDGRHRWSQYVTGSDRDTCNGLVTTSNGVVAAIVDSLPAMSLITWSADGKPGWSKLCTELAPGDFACNVTALASSGKDVAFAARNGGRTSIGRVDPITGAITVVATFEGAPIVDVLAASADSTAFGAAVDREADFGTGPLIPSNADSTFGDVLIGEI
jgi:hypothetical protein